MKARDMKKPVDLTDFILSKKEWWHKTPLFSLIPSFIDVEYQYSMRCFGSTYTIYITFVRPFSAIKNPGKIFFDKSFLSRFWFVVSYSIYFFNIGVLLHKLVV